MFNREDAMHFRGIVSAFLGVSLLSGCTRSADPWASAAPGQKRVLTSFTPLYCFTANVAKGHAQVQCLTTAEGPHDYAATPADALKVAGADLFVINGLELDDRFAENLLKMGRTKKAELFS